MTYESFKQWWRKKSRKEKLKQLTAEDEYLNTVIFEEFERLSDTLTRYHTDDDK